MIKKLFGFRCVIRLTQFFFILFSLASPHFNINGFNPESEAASPVIGSSEFFSHLQRSLKGELKENNHRKEYNSCHELFGKREYLSQPQAIPPPALFTFPGSGNTWCRLLIEFGSGIYSGSMYNDASLYSILPGEAVCNNSVSVIKAHPTYQTNRRATLTSSPSGCFKGKLYSFRKAVLLLRDPFASIWSTYQFLSVKSHVDGILRQKFNRADFEMRAIELSKRYANMWFFEYPELNKWLPDGEKGSLFIRFEDLVNKTSRNDALYSIISFIDLNSSNERIACSFVLSQQAKRKTNSTNMINADDGFTSDLVCRMWAIFGRYALKVGYKPYKNIDCSHQPFLKESFYIVKHGL
eukprot:gene5346-7417_t